MGQLGVGPAQVVGSDIGVLLDAAPDSLGGERVALVDAAEHGALGDLGRCRPLVDGFCAFSIIFRIV